MLENEASAPTTETVRRIPVTDLGTTTAEQPVAVSFDGEMDVRGNQKTRLWEAQAQKVTFESGVMTNVRFEGRPVPTDVVDRQKAEGHPCPGLFTGHAIGKWAQAYCD